MLKLKKDNKAAPETDKKLKPVGKPQGITARGNALRKLAVVALLAVLVPIALGFSYLTALHEPAVQSRQIERVASSFATQQATNMHRLFARMKDRIQGAARSPLALSAIASQSKDDIGLVEQAMLDYFPEVISLRIIPIGEMGTADFEGGNQGLRNHIEVDLVRRTSVEQQTEPEAYKFENQWLTSMAALVKHPRIADRLAVIIVTINNEQISKQLKSLDTGVGKFALEQPYTSTTGVDRTDVVAFTGSSDATLLTRYANIPDTPWRVAFTPSRALVDSLTTSQLPLFAVMALSILGAIAAVTIILILFPRTLASEVKKVISAADRKSPLELAIPELVAIAKQLRRATLRTLRQHDASSTEIPQAEVEVLELQSSDLTNPMFQSTSILDVDEEVLELDLAEVDDRVASESAGMEGFPQHIFRAYDIRGNAQDELSDELITGIARAIGSIAGEMHEQTLIVGCDGRTSSPRIKSALIRALMESGRDVVDIGMVPTPLLYFATRHLSCKSGVMVTGSHNPAQDNGLKIVLNQQTIATGGIRQIRDRVVRGEFSKGNGRMIREDIAPAYMEEVVHDIAIAVPLKIVIDAGNGAAGTIAPHLFEELGCEVVPLYCDVVGTFPNRPPDTSNEDNLADLVRVVQEQEADFGVAFDGDGDRLAVVTSSGRIVRSDVLLMIYAQDVVARNPGADVVFDVKCSRNLTKLITRHGGRPVLWKTGHAFMKEKMAETGALLGGEFSGHMFFGERWYGFDDGMYAAARLAEILSTHGDSLDDVIAELPASINTPEIIIPVAEQDKFSLIERIVNNADFSPGKINTMDGIRVDFTDGWGLVRASNTGAALTARFEADTEESLEVIMAEFRAQIALVEPDLELNF
ncbi:MAG TPA: phosphomannomutase/phosphoglucomutase [Halieaceae bacterium]|nr:phosphomannomutase/phosphoglucomutase [Halieaceae bacterium]